MEVSLPAIIGAIAGLAIGLIDYRMIAGILRAKREEKRRTETAFVPRLSDRQFDGFLMVLMVAIVGGFPIIGYLMGKAVGG